MNESSIIIEARGLTRHYQRGQVRALNGIDLSIAKGRIVGLIGPNGSGKTTALKAMLGLTPYAGELKVLGLDPSRDRDRLMERVCFIADVAVLPRWANVTQMIDLTEGMHPRFNRGLCLQYLEASSVRLDAKVGALSRGMVVQLHLALVMAIDADILVLDEPTLGLDLLFRKKFYQNLLNDYFNEERTIIITTHQVEEIEHILTDLIFIKQGELILNESIDDVMSHYCELTVASSQVDQARALGPIAERMILNQYTFLYKDASAEHLAPLGEPHPPSISDLFVGLMTNSKQG